jgi:hypothetical protein
VGRWEKFQKKKKRNWVGIGDKIKFPKKIRDKGKKKVGRGQGENKVPKKNSDQG